MVDKKKRGKVCRQEKYGKVLLPWISYCVRSGSGFSTTRETSPWWIYVAEFCRNNGGVTNHAQITAVLQVEVWIIFVFMAPAGLLTLELLENWDIKSPLGASITTHTVVTYRHPDRNITAHCGGSAQPSSAEWPIITTITGLCKITFTNWSKCKLSSLFFIA